MLFVFLLLITINSMGRTAQLTGNEKIPIISQDQIVNFDGSYRTSYETGNGISAQEQGVLKNVGNRENEAEEVQGSFHYTSPDGQSIAIEYVANENGFQPLGSHIPVPPPVPDAIRKSIEWNAAHPEEDESSKRFK